MKTLKISAIATLASILAWRIRLPHKVWPPHPQLAEFLMAIALCVILQVFWSETEPSPQERVASAESSENLTPSKKARNPIH